ncbi:tetratricopeptide repeat protein [Streptomyces sp. NPDC057257]|uniref:tetratricopeptide repeat protein n=1 Tax=Streptomyces sp. NPDC057257 TaxID=3346071 RepID=UPI00363E16DC
MRMWGNRSGGWWLLVTVAVGVSGVSWLARLLPGVVGGAMVAVAATVGAALTQRGQRLVEEAASRGGASGDGLLHDRQGRLPRLRDIDDLLVIGVHPAAPEGSTHAPGSRVPPFVRRDRSAEIEDALRTERFVLVVGESTAGKSRAAFEAAQAVLPQAALVLPDPTEPAALRAAAAAVRRERRSVVWLDDVERYLGAGGLTLHLLERLAPPGAVVLATIRAQERARYTDVQGLARDPSDGSGGRVGRDVLALTREIRLDRRWHAEEVARAREFGDDRRLAQAADIADRYGVAEFLAAGPQLLAAWQDAWAPEGRHVRGAALVSAAVEARRAGWNRPLPAALLRDLHERQLTAHGGIRLRPESWEEALEWATRPLYATSGLLIPHDSAPDAYTVFDYLPDAVDDPVLDDTWERLIAVAEPEVCVDIGWAAIREVRHTAARDAFQRALDNGVVVAAAGLALLLGQNWRLDEACQVLRTALHSAPADTDPQSLYELRSDLSWWTGGAGNKEEALELATELHEEARLRYGEDHPESIATAFHVTRWTAHLGRPAAALDLALDALERSLRTLGPTHRVTLDCRFEVAGCTAACGRTAEAVRLWGELADDATRLLGPLDRLTVDARWNLAGAVCDAGDTALGLRLTEEVVDGRTALYGADHPRTFAVRLQQAALTARSVARDEALALLAPLHQDTMRALGPEHELTLAARHQLALCGNADLRALLTDCERALEPDHPLTEDCRARLTDPNRPAWHYEPPSW